MVIGMGRIYNREMRKLTAAALLLFLAVLFAANMAQSAVIREQRKSNQEMFAVFFGNVREKYPQVQEEEWIALLNGTEHVEAGRELLRRYGILEGKETFEVQERFIRQTRGWMNGCLALLFLLLGGLVIFSLQKRQRRLDELAVYLQKVAQGEYMLELEKQREDELSSLQNELYKVVVLLREQAERLKGQKKALADSVSDISHQLKTPLTSVMVLVDNLSESSRMPEETRKHFLNEITAQLGGMAWLVATMLKLSRLDAGVVELEHQPLSGEQLLRQVADGLEQQAEWREVELELRVREDALIRGDGHWLKEALSNIVKNGVEQSLPGSRVVIALEDNAVYTEITVQNFGGVISEEEQKHIFERFYRRKTDTRPGGESRRQPAGERVAGMENIGIGLALAKEIVERQNGFIAVESTEERGTIFTLKFMKNYS